MYKRILVALDQPDRSSQAYGQAVSLAVAGGAKLLLLHVLFPGEGGAPLPPGDDLFLVPAFVPEPPTLDRYRQAWDEHVSANLVELKALATAANQQGLETEWSQNYGSPGPMICNLAKSWEADLIVVGRHHQSALSELFMGSVSNYVLHHATCSVLVVR